MYRLLWGREAHWSGVKETSEKVEQYQTVRAPTVWRGHIFGSVFLQGEPCRAFSSSNKEIAKLHVRKGSWQHRTGWDEETEVNNTAKIQN